jgi:hypothetical protein
MPTAQEVYESMLRGPVAESLHTQGFTGTFRKFKHRYGDYEGLIDFEKSRHSTKEKIPSYTVALWIRHLPTGTWCWGPTNLRGLLPQAHGLPPLYSLEANQTPDDAASSLISDLIRYGVPAITGEIERLGRQQ